MRWWGEGEIQLTFQGDKDSPTLSSTGTNNHFISAYKLDDGSVNGPMNSGYREFTTPYNGVPQVLSLGGACGREKHFGVYRWHLTDTIRFENGPKVSITIIGWHTEKKNRHYQPLQDDIASVAPGNQTQLSAQVELLPDCDYL